MGELYPVFLDLTGRGVVVVGAGQVAQRKVAQLLQAQAQVVVISPQASEQLEAWARSGQIQWRQRLFRQGDTDGAWLVVAASDQPQVNRAVRQEADAQGIFCNVVDMPSLCSFQAPAVMRRGLLAIAISTGGASPALASRIRKELEEHYGPCYETFLAALAQLRTAVKDRYPLADDPRRQAVLEGFLQSQGLDLLQAGKQEAFDELFKQWLES